MLSGTNKTSFTDLLCGLNMSLPISKYSLGWLHNMLLMSDVLQNYLILNIRKVILIHSMYYAT